MIVGLASCVAAPSPGDVEGRTVAYEVAGSGDVTLMFVHGWACDRSYWREQVAARLAARMLLAKLSWVQVLPRSSAPGFGGS